MKAMWVRTEYGKNRKYINAGWVVENALETFKKETTEKIRSYGWTKEINFTVYDKEVELEDNNTSYIRAYTANGCYEDVSVK